MKAHDRGRTTPVDPHALEGYDEKCARQLVRRATRHRRLRHFGAAPMERLMRLPTLAFTTLFLVAGLSACSSRQFHATGQQWQRNECERLQDGAERNRCLADSKRSYDDYQRQKDAVQAR